MEGVSLIKPEPWQKRFKAKSEGETIVLLAKKDLSKVLGFQFDYGQQLYENCEFDGLLTLRTFLVMTKKKKPADFKYTFGQTSTNEGSNLMNRMGSRLMKRGSLLGPGARKTFMPGIMSLNGFTSIVRDES